MASNKQHDNRGIGPHDEEQLRRLSRARHATDASAPGSRAPSVAGSRAARSGALGDTVESTEGTNITHRNR